MKSVYIELFMLDNILINYYFLYLSGAVLRYPIKKFPGLVSAFVGAIYGYLQLSGVSFLNSPFLKLGLSVMMIYLSYCPSRKAFPRLLLSFYGFSFAFAGGILAFFYVSPKDSFLRRVFFLPVPLRFALLILLSGHFLKKYLLTLIAMLTYCRQGISLHISCLETPVTLPCFGDTGNGCTYFGKPVAFVNRSRLKLDNETANLIKGNISNGQPHISIVYIPFKSAGGVLQIVPGFKCEKAVLSQGSRTKELCMYIALTDHDFGGEPCLINPVLLD